MIEGGAWMSGVEHSYPTLPTLYEELQLEELQLVRSFERVYSLVATSRSRLGHC